MCVKVIIALGTKVGWRHYGKILGMIGWLRHLLGWTISAFRSREDLVLEKLALRQQLRALHSHRPRRRLTAAHKLFWVALQRLWSRWKESLILVTPRTVVGWHRAGFACIGNGFPDREIPEGESAFLWKFEL